MSTKSTTRRTPIRAKMTPVDQIPDANTGGAQNGPAPYWVEVAETCKANPGQPFAVRLDHLTIKGHASAASRINAASRQSAGKTSRNPAFAEPGFTAAYREGVLYVRYDAPAVTVIRSKTRRAS